MFMSEVIRLTVYRIFFIIGSEAPHTTMISAFAFGVFTWVALVNCC